MEKNEGWIANELRIDPFEDAPGTLVDVRLRYLDGTRVYTTHLRRVSDKLDWTMSGQEGDILFYRVHGISG